MASSDDMLLRKIAPLPNRSKKRELSQGRPSSQSSSSEADNIPATPDSSTDEATVAIHQVGGSNSPGTQVDTISNFSSAQSGVFVERSITLTPELSEEKQGRPTSSRDGDLKIVVTPDHELPQPLYTLDSGEKTLAGDRSENLPEVMEDARYKFSPDGIEVRGSVSLSTPLSHSRRSSGNSFATDSSDDAEYVVEEEEAPVETFFTDGFQYILRRSYNVAIKVAQEMEKLEKTFETDSNFQRLLNDARGLSTVNISKTRTIAVLGASGEGKSSLINSLLHVTELARTGDEGAACTSVVTEYRQKKRTTLESFSIEAEYLSNSERREMVEELLWSFRQLFLPDIDPSGGGVDFEEQQRIERESAVARSALEAVFSEQEGFSIDFLSDNSDGAFERIKNQLLSWIQNIKFPTDDDSGLWTATADTPDECQDLTSVFMENRLWPFTKIIRVYLDAEVLKTGVVLADLPGLQDTNLARVRATQKYLQDCDHVFIATKISRAITDATLKSALYDELKRHVPLAWEETGVDNTNFKLAVICTRSEDINEKTAKRAFVGEGKELSTSDISLIDKDIDSAKRKGDKKSKKELERKKRWLFIEARNRHVTERLQTAYRQKIPNGCLDVFCVSNTTYGDYAEKGNIEMVQKSGIPELRRFCRKITASAQLLQALHFMRSRLPSLLNSIKIWTESTHALAEVHKVDIGASIMDRHERCKNEALASVLKHHGEFRDVLQNDILRFFNKSSIQWEGNAASKAREWSLWHFQSYKAWCRNNGEHETGTRGYVNWNAEMIERMRIDLKTKWELLEEKVTTIIEGLLQEAKDQLRSLRASIEEQNASTTVQYGIDFRIQDLEYQFSLIEQKFARRLRTIRQYVEEPNASSFIVTDMMPAYRGACSQGGKGMHARQISIITNHTSNGTIFPNISENMRKEMITIIDDQFGKLKGEVVGSFDLIRKDIDMAVAEKPQSSSHALSPEAKKLIDGLAKKLTKLRVRHDEIINTQQHVVGI